MTRKGLSTTVPERLTPVAGAPLWCDARQFGLQSDGVTNDQPALSALVDRLGDGYAADGLARVIYCPPGIYSIPDAGAYGLWITGRGSCLSCRVEDNDFVGNAAGAVRLDTPPVGGRWRHNHGEED